MLEMKYVAQLADGLLVTCELFVFAFILAYAVALTLVVVRATELAPCRWFVDAYVEYHRNVPLLVQVLFWYFGMPQLLPENTQIWLNNNDPELAFAAIALGLGSAAYVAEDIRSGLRGIPKTQFEAVKALGANYFQCMRHVIVPQALRASIPPLIGRAVLLFKNTSIAMAISVTELSYRTQEVENETYRTFAVYGVGTVLYLLGTAVIMYLGSRIYSRYALRR